MSMLEILDGVRKIIHKWVNTATRLTSNVNVGDTVLYVENSYRFNAGDDIIIKNGDLYEVDLHIESVDNSVNTITLSSGVQNSHSLSDGVVIKAIYGRCVQGIYIGDREILPKFPCITVNGVSRSSEWMTLESTKERYEIEVSVFVQASTQEEGYKFLLTITDIIQQGLKRNIMPLVNDFDIISLAQDVTSGDSVIYVENREQLEQSNFIRIFLEDEYESQENWVEYIYDLTEDPTGESVKLKSPSCFNFRAEDTSVIIPKRHIFNSWPHSIQYGMIHKGELLKAAKISWFAEEEELQEWRKQEPKLR